MDKKEEKERKIPTKNYIILVVLFIAIIALVLYLCNLYHVYDAHQREIPVIRDTLFEIQPEEIEHYVMENPTTVFYMCTAASEACRDYEKDLKKLVEKDELQSTIIYVNLSNVDQNEFVDTFNAQYPYKVSLKKNYPALIVFEDGDISSILQPEKGERLTISETEQFIKLNKIKKEGE